jgi:Disulfide bond chaperones of the HSP33 family
MLHVDDLQSMEGESQEIVCHYCGRKMMISKEEIQELIEKARAKMN